MPRKQSSRLAGMLATLALLLSTAITADELPIFAVADHSDPRTLTLSTPADAQVRLPATVDLDVLKNNDRVVIVDEAGHRLVLESNNREALGPQAHVWRGHVLRNGKASGSTTLSVEGDRIHGVLRSREASYRISGDSLRGYVIDRINLGTIPASHPPVDLPSPGANQPAAMQGQASVSEEPVVVDLLAHYTTAAVEEYGSEADLRLAIRTWAALANSAYLNSDIDHRVRLLGIVHRQHEENPEDMPSSLVAFANDSAIQRVGNLYAADLQAQYGVFSDYCGIAYVLSEYSDDWEWGYSTNNANSAYPCGFINVLGHEMGHNMGLHHDPDTASNTDNVIEPFAFGHVMQDQFTTVMAYHSGCGGGEYDNCGSSIDYFSHPAKEDPVYGLPLGVEGERDNAEVLRRSMPYAASWRELPIGFDEFASGRYSTTGAGLWAIQDEVTFDGEATFVSGPVYGEEESRLILERNSPQAMSLSFSARVEADAVNQGRLTLLADDDEILTIDDLSEDWQAYEVTVAPGTTTLSWHWTSPGRPSVDDGLGVAYMTTGPRDTGGRSSSGCSLHGERPDPLFLLMLMLAAGLRRRSLAA